MALYVENKQIAVPGEVLAEGDEYISSYGTRKMDDKIIANRVGLVNIHDKKIKLVQLNGSYLPKVNDVIIGHVFEMTTSGWRVKTNSPYPAMITLKEASNEFIPRGADLKSIIPLGAYVAVKVVNITSNNLVDVSMKGPGLRKLHGGRILKISPNKVPRVIGKNGSMISLIKKATGCRIIVAQNGIIWIQGNAEDELNAQKVVNMIELKAHTSGLTDKVKEHLEGIYGKFEEKVEQAKEFEAKPEDQEDDSASIEEAPENE